MIDFNVRAGVSVDATDLIFFVFVVLMLLQANSRPTRPIIIIIIIIIITHLYMSENTEALILLIYSLRQSNTKNI